MPLLKSSYRPPSWMKGAHLQTIYPNFFRKVDFAYGAREDFNFSDGDNSSLYWKEKNLNKNKLVLLCHGFEGDAHRPYMLGMARAAFQEGYSVLAWNMRGCETMNSKPHFYHSGLTEDLEDLVQIALGKGFEELYLVGFSLGGNLVLKWTAEYGPYHPELKAVAAFSVPCDLAGSARKISAWNNLLYQKRFLNSLKQKMAAKKKSGFPEISWTKPSTIRDFDHHYTAPMHGYESAEHYYFHNSSKQYLHRIETPTLLLNAMNDTFISRSSTPNDIAFDLRHVYVEPTAQGGHCGFWPKNYKGRLYTENRAIRFFKEMGS